MASTRLAPTGLALTALCVGTCLIASGAAAGEANTSTSASVSNPDNCKVVERKPGDDNGSGTLSTSVTAGNGKVKSTTTGGHGVTVQSGNGQVSSSVATTGSRGGATTVTSSDGHCTIYVDPGQKKD